MFWPFKKVGWPIISGLVQGLVQESWLTYHIRPLIGWPIISGCDGPTECISLFVDRLVQPIAQSQDSYHKDTTEFINFVEKTKVPADVILVSMDVTSLYTNMPLEIRDSQNLAKVRHGCTTKLSDGGGEGIEFCFNWRCGWVATMVPN